MTAFEYVIVVKGKEKKDTDRLVTSTPQLILAKDEQAARVLAARDQGITDEEVDRAEILVRPF